MKDRILDTQSPGNMSTNPPIEFEITILKTTYKDVCMQNQGENGQMPLSKKNPAFYPLSLTN